MVDSKIGWRTRRARGCPRRFGATWGIKDERNGLSEPAIRAEGREGDERVELKRKEAYKYTGTTARANCMGLERPDVQLAVKKTCGRIARATDKDVGMLGRYARYLQKVPGAVLKSRRTTPLIPM